MTGADPQSTQTYHNENPERPLPFHNIPQSTSVVMEASDGGRTIDPRGLESESSRPHLSNMENGDETSYYAQPIPQLLGGNEPTSTGQFYNQ
jgi:hypothetical protein